MKFCANCGAPLRPESPGVCAECGAEQSRGSSKPDYVPPRKKKRGSRRLVVLGLISLVLTVLLIAGAAATAFLYNRYNPDDTLERFGDALLTKDFATLRSLIRSDGVSVSDDGLNALCRAFSTQEQVDALMQSLRGGRETPSAPAGEQADGTYSALELNGTPVFLGYSSYTVLVRPVSLLLTGDLNTPALTVDGAARSGSAAEGGILYAGFFPGMYTVTASDITITGQTLSGTAADLVLTDAETPVSFSGNLPIRTVTVENCIDDTAVISVDGTVVSQTPSGGTVTLPHVAVGSTISMEYTAPHGAKTTASVTFADASVTALRFENHATEGGIPSEEELNNLLGTYYSSYLDCINSQDMTQLLASTDLNRDRLSELYNNESNLSYAFTFESAAVNYTSAVSSTYEELPSVVCSVLFHYRTTDRTSGEDASHDSFQTCELVYQEGAWLVNRAVTCTQDQYNASERAELP